MAERRRGILILDYGSQYTQLIARRVREQNVYCEIRPPPTLVSELEGSKPEGIVLSGGPDSVYDPAAPQLPRDLLTFGVPILGICYGMQALVLECGGVVERADEHEYGRADVTILSTGDLFEKFEEGSRESVWASHGDRVSELPTGFSVTASSNNAVIAAFSNPDRGIYGVQFHPEVAHTARGREMLNSFLFQICGCTADWTPAAFIDEQIETIKLTVGSERHVICGLSGGVDSSVAAVLVHRAIGDRLTCIFVDHGLLRSAEAEQVEEMFVAHMGIDLRVVDASERFLRKLEAVEDPEEKRRVIGHTFIDVFEDAARCVEGDVGFLVQGTLYPDVIESLSAKGGPSATIKTHHNVGGLRPDLPFELIEPLQELFKDEVREVGRALGLPEEIVRRHPFPGPGLAVRIIGSVTKERVEVLRHADAIYLEEISRADLYDEIWQAFAVLLPVKSVGVMGDARTYGNVVALRAVTSTDGMTADWYEFPSDVLARVSGRIINEVSGVNRVVYDVSTKPPATIEWE